VTPTVMIADSEYKDDLVVLHKGVLRGDASSRERLAAVLLKVVPRILRREMPYIDGHIVNDGVEDALMSYFGVPSRYDPLRARLDTFIVTDARRRIHHELRSMGRRRLREARFVRTDDLLWPDEEYRAARVDVILRRLIAAVAQGQERALLEAKVDGERRTDVLAAILGVAAASTKERRLAVRRAVDKLKARLRRLLRRRAVCHRPNADE
jgi:hypothetical protein